MISADIDLNTSTSKIKSTIMTKIWSIFNSSSNCTSFSMFCCMPLLILHIEPNQHQTSVCVCVSVKTTVDKPTPFSNTATQCPSQHHHHFFLLFGSCSRKEICGVESPTLRVKRRTINFRGQHYISLTKRGKSH